MRVDIAQNLLPKVIDKLAVSDRITVVFGGLPERKIRVTSSSWDDAKVILHDQIAEARNFDG